MTNQNSKCCEKCTGERNPTMMCQNIFCPCHTTSKSEEIDQVIKYYGDQIVCISCGQKKTACKCKKPFTRLENWEEESLFETRLAIFIDFVEKEANRIDEERRGAHRKDGGRKMQSILFLKSFISTLLQEERGKTFEEGLRWGRASLKAELVGKLEEKKEYFLESNNEGQMSHNLAIGEAIELVKKI